MVSANNPNTNYCNFTFDLQELDAFDNVVGTVAMTVDALTNFFLTKGTAIPPYKVPGYRIRVNPAQGVDHTLLEHDFTINLKWNILETPDLLYGAGKRIRKIEHIAETGIISTKEFTYLNTSGTTSGKSFGIPFFYDVLEKGDGVTVAQTHASGGGSPLTSLAGNSLGYSHVTEYFGTVNDNIGKTAYEFTNIENTGDFYVYPYHIPTDNEWLRGKNLTTKVYSTDGTTYTLQKEVINEYLYANETYQGFGASEAVFTPISAITDLGSNLFGNSLLYSNTTTKHQTPLISFSYPRDPVTNQPDFTNPKYTTYHLTGGTVDLKKSTSKDYYDGGLVYETVTENFYDYNRHYQLKSSKVTDSKGDVLETKNYYPTDLADLTDIVAPQTTHINALKTANRWEVIQTESYKNTNLTSKLRNTYLNNSGVILPKSVQTAKGTAALEERIVYHSYYSNGNVQEVSKTDGTHIVYIWGYDQTVPIAKIENATFSDIPTSIYSGILNASNADDDRTQGTTGNEGALRTELDKLRNASLCPNLVNAQITTFTYDPLIGVTSVTDPRGRMAYYLYDNFNRLLYVKDHDGNILSANEYHYKN